MKIFAYAFAASAAATLVDATSIKMDFLPIGHVRTDPILSKTCLSGHVHSFYGAQVLPHPATTDYDGLRAVADDQNSGNVVENKSLYWHPSIYSYDSATDTYTRQEMAQTSAYYVWVTGQATAFPNGFQMIGGFPGPGNFPRPENGCARSRPSTRPACPASFGDITFFPTEACDELEASMIFPSCWDGVNLSSANGRDHVAYTSDGDVEGSCPDGYPVRLPQIHFFFRIIPYAGGCHVFSDRSQVFHADYISGWDELVLQRVLDECSNESLSSNPDAFCETHVKFRDAPKCTDESVCDFGDPVLLNKLRDIQPPPIDMKSITTEEIDTVVGTLPGGPDFKACNGPGSLLPPTAAATLAPSPYPTFVIDFDGDDQDEPDEDDNVDQDDVAESEEDDETEPDDDQEQPDDEGSIEEEDDDVEGSDDETDSNDDQGGSEEDDGTGSSEEGDSEEEEDDDDEGDEDGDSEEEACECHEFLEECLAECKEEEESSDDLEECQDGWCMFDFEECEEALDC